MKLKKTIKEFFEIQDALNKLDAIPGFKFRIIIARNLAKIESELEPITEKLKPSKELQAVLDKEEEIKVKYAKKDKMGNPKIIFSQRPGMNHKYDISEEDLEKLEDERAKYWKKPENAKLKKDYEKQREDYFSYIDENSIEIDLIPIPEKYIPTEFFDDPKNSNFLTVFVTFLQDLIEDAVEQPATE